MQRTMLCVWHGLRLRTGASDLFARGPAMRASTAARRSYRASCSPWPPVPA